MSLFNIIFSIIFFLSFGFFLFNLSKIVRNIRLGRSINRFNNPLLRTKILLKVAFGQTKLFARPVSGILHALVYWGFLVITIGTLEMIIDGIFFDRLDRSFGVLGSFYDIVTASGDIMSILVLFSCIIFLSRRLVLRIKRFSGKEIKISSSIDAVLALFIIIFLMISLLTMNIGYIGSSHEDIIGYYPVSNYLLTYFFGYNMDSLHAISWWTHIILVLLFLNKLPYSKHFHVVMSIPNVYFSNLENLGKIENMDSVTREVHLMMGNQIDDSNLDDHALTKLFGAKDVKDLNWVQLMNAYSCTECGRCTSECPANQTGKLLSPRKIMMDTRQRLKEVGKNIDIHGKEYNDDKNLLHDYISEEEIWACTTCNACTQSCPLNIDPLSIILDLRRYLVMEQSSAPTELNTMFTNIENNGAPWQFPASDRLKWKDEETN